MVRCGDLRHPCRLVAVEGLPPLSKGVALNVSILVPLALSVVALFACAAALWVGESNTDVSPKRSDNNERGTERPGNGLFRAFDRVPCLRRSGHASVNDLAKALFIVLAVSFIPGALAAGSAVVPLWWSATLLTAVACILFAHPFLSHRQSFRDNLRGRSPLKGER